MRPLLIRSNHPRLLNHIHHHRRRPPANLLCLCDADVLCVSACDWRLQPPEVCAATDNLVPSSEWPGTAWRAAPIPGTRHTAAQRVRRRFAGPGGVRVDAGRPDEQPGPGGLARHLQRPAHLQLEWRGEFKLFIAVPWLRWISFIYLFYLLISCDFLFLPNQIYVILFLHNSPSFLSFYVSALVWRFSLVFTRITHNNIISIDYDTY